MFTISFEVENMKDLQTQVNNMVGQTLTTETITSQHGVTIEKLPVVENPVENRNEVVAIAPKFDPNPLEVETQPMAVSQAATGAADSHGVPWDSRIHASSRATVKDGGWKKKRNLPDDIYEQVLAEINGNAPAPLINESPMIEPPLAPTPIPQPIVPVPSVTVAPPVAVPTLPPVNPPPVTHVAPPIQSITPAQVYEPAPVPTSDKPAHNLETFKANFAQIIAQLKVQQLITNEYIQSLNEHFGVAQLWDIIASEEKITEMFNNFAEYGWVTKVD